MHIQSVEIERLLTFKKLSVDMDADLQLIAGPNNAGKSSLITVLDTFFSDPSPEDMQLLKPLHDYYVSGGGRMMSSIKVRFGGLDDAEAAEFADVTARDGSLLVEVACTRGGQMGLLHG